MTKTIKYFEFLVRFTSKYYYHIYQVGIWGSNGILTNQKIKFGKKVILSIKIVG